MFRNQVAQGVLGLIGNTPLVALTRLTPPGSATVLAKVEALNPSGSIKDRIALAMVEDAEAKGLLKPGATIIEPSSGNTAIALALVGTLKGHRVVVVMPEDVAPAWRSLIIRFGGELHLTRAREGMPGAMKAAQELAQKEPMGVLLRQFENPANVEAHRRTTAQEILDACSTDVDSFVAGVGTGGTITGVGERLKKELSKVSVIAVQPARSPVLTGGAPGEHYIYGIGASFVPPILNRAIIDEVISVPDEEAYKTAHQLAQREGLLVGMSSGANVYTALKVAQRLGPGKTVVTVLPDSWTRYLSLPL
jgi:cysteine synthase A